MRDAGEQRQEGLQEPADVLQHPLPASTHHRSGCPGKRDAVQNRVRRNHPGERCGSAYAPAGDEIWGVHSARSTFRPHSILHARAKELAAQENSFIVQYGINIIGYGDTLLTAVAAQTENLPDDIENLVMTCGSGITATGVMIGLHRYGKRVKRMHLVATAPDRRGFIHETLKKYGADREFEYHDLFHSPGFVYEKSAAATWGGIRLHPHYEAKTMQWFRSSGIAPESTLFWITGAEPRSPGQS